jgi:hypothetical protein
MTDENYKAWLDAMPIDGVRHKIERIERKLADLQLLVRLYEERHPSESDGPTEPAPESEGFVEPTG